MSIKRQMDKQIEYHLVTKRDQLLIQATKQMNSKNIMLSKKIIIVLTQKSAH